MNPRVTPQGRSDRRLVFLSLVLGAGLAAAALADTPTPRIAGGDGERGASAAARSAPQPSPAGPASPSVRSGAPGGGEPVAEASRRHPRHDRRPHPVSPHRVHPRFYGPSWNYGIYWGWPYYWGTWGYPYHYPAVVYSGGAERLGALDLDVAPERAQVFLDGQYLGVCDDFDGFPEYLWLEPGTYDLVFFHEGYRTVAHQVTVRAGLMIDFNDRMVPGESVRPEDLPSKSTVRREERLRRDRETAAEARAAEAAREEAWRTRREPIREVEAEIAEAPAPGPLDARGEPGRLQLRVEPMDASIYLDGRFLGTGEELARLRSSLLVDAGKHRLEIVRPGYESVEKEFVATPGEEVVLKLVLEEE